MTYLDWLHSFDHIDDNRKAATAALKDLGRLNERARGLLHPILAEALLIARRDVARGVERTTPISSVFDGETSIERRRNRLEQTFPVDGRRVSWLEATVADHRARIEYLQRHMAGVMRTVEQHESAIATIRAHGVTCLGEIEEAS